MSNYSQSMRRGQSTLQAFAEGYCVVIVRDRRRLSTGKYSLLSSAFVIIAGAFFGQRKSRNNDQVMTKLVTLECHEPMGRDRLVQQPWSDVSVTFIDQPGGETLRFEPTLLSKTCLERDLLDALESQRKHPKADRSPVIGKLEKILKALNEGAEFYVESATPEDTIPEIYTRNPYLDQPVAERMLAHFLGTRGFTDLGFQWVWPEFIATVG